MEAGRILPTLYKGPAGEEVETAQDILTAMKMWERWFWKFRRKSDPSQKGPDEGSGGSLQLQNHPVPGGQIQGPEGHPGPLPVGEIGAQARWSATNTVLSSAHPAFKKAARSIRSMVVLLW